MRNGATIIENEGTSVEIGRNSPLRLDGSESLWIIAAGGLDVFAVRIEDGEPSGPLKHLFRAEAGQALLGTGPDGDPTGVALVARAVADTTLLEIDRSRLRELAKDPSHGAEVAALLDGWIDELSAGLAPGAPPQKYRALHPEAEISLEDGEVARTDGAVVWVRQLAGSIRFLDAANLDGEVLLPVSRHVWLQAAGESQLSGVGTQVAISDDAAWRGLERFHRAALERARANMEREAEAERHRLQRMAESDRHRMAESLAGLSSVLATDEAAVAARDDAQDPLLAACRLVGAALGIPIRAHRGSNQGRGERDPLANIARASRVRTRRVALRGEWWRNAHGPLLAFVEEDRRPVALLPVSAQRYELADPGEGTKTPVTPEIAASLSPFAYAFFRPLPDRAVTVRDLVRLGFRGLAPDIRRLLLTGTAVGMLGLAVPIAMRVVFDTIIPAGDRAQLLGLSLALLVAAGAAALLQLVQAIALLRVETQAGAATQAAVWDRLLDLPAAFFRRYSAGDLAVRAMGVDTIRRFLAGIALPSVVAGFFSVLNLGLLVYYDATLALLATGLVVVAVLATVLAGYRRLRYERQATVIEAKTSGMVLQLVTGISKLRIAGAEARAFASWAERFTAQRRLEFKARTAANGLAVFNAAFPAVTSIALFAAIAFRSEEAGSTGTLVAFVVAFGGLLTGALTTSAGIVSVLGVVPIFENMKPILRTLPEVDPARSDPGELSGRIEVSHVSFRYRPDGPLVLSDVSLHAEPGEFIAIVGPSGSGKSTIFRTLLGFETPESGSIYYDGQELTELDIQAVRRQIGVVLQDSRVMAGDILTNITGSSLVTPEEAWEAARMAGLDEDIRQMPMGMHTVVPEGGSTFSGGQRQRLLIARAVVGRPRILLFDEATSALDNRTQAVVSESLQRLQATRIVIAHRLSTIIHADRIYVIHAGRVVQSGRYDELANQPGAFQELIRRQVL